MKRCLFVLFWLAGCGGYGESDVLGEPTGALCDEDQRVTYRAFVKPFVEAYCLRCHSRDVPAARRNGAPLDHDFDDEWAILDEADHLDRTAAAGPDAINRTMPPNGPRPTDEERRLLGIFLACRGSEGHSHDAGAD